MRQTSSSDAKSRIGESDRPGRRPVNGRYRSIPQMRVSQYDWRQTGCRSMACGVRGIAPDHPSGANGPASAGMRVMIVGRGALPSVTGRLMPKISRNSSMFGVRPRWVLEVRLRPQTISSVTRMGDTTSNYLDRYTDGRPGSPGLLVKFSSKPASCQ